MVTVVGGGVIGLTCALELARAGHAVTVVSADPPEATTSAVAAAIWFPYEAAPADAVLRWGRVSLVAFMGLAGSASVTMRTGRVVLRRPDADTAWAAEVPGARVEAEAVRCELPVIEMGTYLGWLAERLRAAGVTFRDERLAALPDGVVVNAAGLGARSLCGDASVSPIRGQVVRLANPGVTEWVIDDDHPGGMAYVIPREHDVVCGGTADRGASDTKPDAAVEAAILARCRDLVPALHDAPIVSRAVGLRPARPVVRLEREGDIIHCYGHGGAGVTLSWGCARDVVALV